MFSRVVSSAYMIGHKLVLAVVRSLMYIRNNNGPRIEYAIMVEFVDKDCTIDCIKSL